MMAKKILVICGPTAVGKTSLGIRLAKKFDGEIISADSRQVYKGLDIGTGKELGIIRKVKVPIHLLDVINPDEEFNVAKYSQLTWPIIKKIWKKAKLPIMVGGTGFYIKAIVDGLDSLGIEPDWQLRKILRYKEIEILGNKLKKLDPERLKKMNESDRRNPRRLIRAIEIATAKTQKSPRIEYRRADILMVGLKAPKEILYAKIDQRVEKRVKQGAENEIRRLVDKGYNWGNSVLGETIGYQEWQPFFEGKASKKDIIQRWKFNEHAYARRQLTWFQKDKRVRWFNFTEPGLDLRVENLVKNWYTKSNATKS